jgi:hypothetical protein
MRSIDRPAGHLEPDLIEAPRRTGVFFPDVGTVHAIAQTAEGFLWVSVARERGLLPVD